MTNQNDRIILDNHIGHANVVDGDMMESIILDTMSTLRKLLRDHCGPHSTYAILGDPDNPVAEPKYTRDGINIIRATEFVNPVQTYARQMLHYIGSKVEMSSGDGTTSSMMIVVNVLEQLFAESIHKQWNYNQVRAKFDDLCTRIEKGLKERAVTIDLDTASPEEIYAMVYAQARTSSHGDDALSEAVATMFQSSKPGAWNYLYAMTEDYETDTRYTVVNKPSDFTTNGGLFSKSMANLPDKSGSVYTGAKLIVVGHFASGTDSWKLIVDEISRPRESDEHLVIVGPRHIDAACQQELEELMGSRYSQGNIGVVLVPARGNLPFDDLVSLIAVGGYTPDDLNGGAVTWDNIDIAVDARDISISGIGTYLNGVHASAFDQDTYLGRYVDMMDKYIETVSAADPQYRLDQGDLAHLNRIRNQVVYLVNPYLVIGGAGYDSVAARDVVEDVVKAARKAVKTGLVLGGYSTLKQVLLEDICGYDADPFDTLFVKTFVNAIDDVQTAVIESTPSSISGNDTLPSVGYYRDAITGYDHQLSDIFTSPEKVIVQPYTVDLQMLKRLGESALRFIFARRVIYPNGVILNDTLDNK